MLNRERKQADFIHILLCDDDPIILEAFQEQLEFGRSPFGPRVNVRACSTIDQALALRNSYCPDLLLIDLYICDERFAGIRVLNSFAIYHPTARRIAMTAHGSRLREAELRRLAACRLDGFLDKSIGINRVLQACHRIWQGEVIVSPPFTNWLEIELNQETQAHKSLSPREQEILILRAQSYKIRDISRQLGLSESSVSTHLDRIASKLGTKTPAELLNWCREEGLAI